MAAQYTLSNPWSLVGNRLVGLGEEFDDKTTEPIREYRVSR
jgi:hypothetical protein